MKAARDGCGMSFANLLEHLSVARRMAMDLDEMDVAETIADIELMAVSRLVTVEGQPTMPPHGGPFLHPHEDA